ncbi:MAG: hypothetical protein LBR96_02570, partial [Treponema sp.]|nr:hypothetical protein [Treponema sp.]
FFEFGLHEEPILFRNHAHGNGLIRSRGFNWGFNRDFLNREFLDLDNALLLFGRKGGGRRGTAKTE